MTAVYNGLKFETELEAIWAAFFDLAGWKWWYNPISIDNWQPDFKVTFPCGHSECNGSHTLLVSVVPIKDIASMKDHPSLSHSYDVTDEKGKSVADGGALFGSIPTATQWEITHGSGGGFEDIFSRVEAPIELWRKAVASID